MIYLNLRSTLGDLHFYCALFVFMYTVDCSRKSYNGGVLTVYGCTIVCVCRACGASPQAFLPLSCSSQKGRGSGQSPVGMKSAPHTGEVIMAERAPGPGMSATLLTHTIKTKTIFTWR